MRACGTIVDAQYSTARQGLHESEGIVSSFIEQWRFASFWQFSLRVEPRPRSPKSHG